MNIEELIALLERAVRTGRVEPDSKVLFRDYTIDDEEMDQGANGYTEIAEGLIVPGDDDGRRSAVYLLGEEGLHS